MIVESPSSELTRPEGGRDTSARLPLADIRRDMTGIFGDPGPTLPTVTPRTKEIAVAGAALVPIGPRRRRMATVPLLAMATAGLLVGMATMGGLQLADLRERIAPLTTIAPATGVTENPFETTMAAPSPAPAAAAIEPTVVTPAPVKSQPPAKPPAAAAITEAKPPNVEPAAQTGGPPQAAAECEGDRLERAWCMRHDILEADRRLRGAYAEAIRQGVERRFLVAHQRRWTRLRNLAAQDPSGVLEGYAELAGDLERLSIHGRAANRIR